MSSTQQLLLGEGAGGGPANYIEDVFSSWIYTGTDATLAIPNGIDLSTKGGLVWIKNRSTNSSFGGNHQLVDTVRGRTATSGSSMLSTNNADSSSGTNGYDASTQGFSSFDTTGFTVKSSGGEVYSGACNTSGVRYTSWTFREQPKFFDIVTYTGNGAAGRQISHNLGSTPGCIIVKTATGGNGWNVWHKDLGDSNELLLNSTAASTSFGYFGGAPTSTTFTVDGAVGNGTNTNGQLFVAYIFANNAGGFGAAGTDNVITCGSFNTDSIGIATVTLGYEPQWLMFKKTNGPSNWTIKDTMRGSLTASISGQSAVNLSANTNGDESTNGDVNGVNATATGFYSNGNEVSGSSTYVYIAIRRGPMKVPTAGTSVYSPIVSSASDNTKLTTGFPVDLQWAGVRAGDSDNMTVIDRLRSTSTNTTQSNGRFLETSQTVAENSGSGSSRANYWDNTGFRMPGAYSGGSMVFWNFGRAPSFFDEVCYTGTGANQTLPHNLGVVPELMITKNRSNSSNWRVYDAFNGPTKRGTLNADTAWDVQSTMWNDTAPTSTVFTVGTSNSASSQTYVIYLFATAAGVSKVFSYTGNGSSQTINCGFTGGARFVLIKRTDDVGDWYVWDSARGIVSGNDPHLSLNTTAAEVTTDDTIDTDSTGFVVNQVSATNVNVSSATYIGIAIA